VFLILDRLPVHRGRAVQDWLAERRSQIEVFHLPAYFDKVTLAAMRGACGTSAKEQALA
jgi:hypothetical protein